MRVCTGMSGFTLILVERSQHCWVPAWSDWATIWLSSAICWATICPQGLGRIFHPDIDSSRFFKSWVDRFVVPAFSRNFRLKAGTTNFHFRLDETLDFSWNWNYQLSDSHPPLAAFVARFGHVHPVRPKRSPIRDSHGIIAKQLWGL